jgi:RNA-directed DNA polymerase
MPYTTGWIARRNALHNALARNKHMTDADTPLEYFSPKMRKVAKALARSFLHGQSDAEGLRQRGATALGRKWPWLNGIARGVLAEFGTPLQARDHDRIIRWILDFPAFANAFDPPHTAPQVRAYFTFHPSMDELPAPLAKVVLPVLHTVGDLAAWLQLSPTELDWFADTAGWGCRSQSSKLVHYDCHWQPKASSGWRLIESPKSRLRTIQRKILHELLYKIPVHPSANGCVPGRSTLGNAAEHVGAPVLLRLDLANFFVSIRASRIHALFRTLGYPVEVSRYLTGLTTHCVSSAVVRAMPTSAGESVESRRNHKTQAKKYLERHLPQGAPTSPTLANLCAYRLDLRLAGAALESCARYTRYVDDLFFSCETTSRAHGRRIALMTHTILIEEGFELNIHKTRITSRSQTQRVTGLVVNDKPNVPRKDYDALKATLTNCIRHGAVSQNRAAHPNFRAHLLGRISYVQHVNPERGLRLRALFERIQWDAFSS